MQDVVAALAPGSLGLLFAAYAPRLSLPRRWRVEMFFTVGFLLYLLINVIINRSVQGIGIIEFVRKHGRVFYVIFLYLLCYSLPRSRGLDRSVYRAAVAVGVFVSIISLFSYFVLPLELLGVKLSCTDRLLGFMGGHNPTAGSLGQVLVLIVLHWWTRGALHLGRLPWTGAAFVVIAAAVLMTKSRGYLLGLAVTFGVAYWLWARRALMSPRSRHGALVVGLVLAAGLLVTLIVLAPRIESAFTSDASVAIRLALMLRAAQFATTSPLTGVGLGTPEQANVTFDVVIPGLVALRRGGNYLPEVVAMNVEGGLHTHNLYLQLVSEVGLVGAGLLAAVIWSGLRRFNASSEQQENRILAGFLTIYLAVAGLTAGYTFLSPGTAWLFYFALARHARWKLDPHTSTSPVSV